MKMEPKKQRITEDKPPRRIKLKLKLDKDKENAISETIKLVMDEYGVDQKAAFNIAVVAGLNRIGSYETKESYDEAIARLEKTWNIKIADKVGPWLPTGDPKSVAAFNEDTKKSHKARREKSRDACKKVDELVAAGKVSIIKKSGGRVLDVSLLTTDEWKDLISDFWLHKKPKKVSLSSIRYDFKARKFFKVKDAIIAYDKMFRCWALKSPWGLDMNLWYTRTEAVRYHRDDIG